MTQDIEVQCTKRHSLSQIPNSHITGQFNLSTTCIYHSTRPYLPHFPPFSTQTRESPISDSKAPSMANPLSTLKRIYFSLYNWALFYFWAQVLYLAVKTIKESGIEHVYDAVEKPLFLSQTAAILEIVHSLIGLVRSPVSATLPQIGSRLFLVWGILYNIPEVRTCVLVSSLVISWSITEVIRYSFFGMKELLGITPSFLTWLRYSSFLVLYPSGISSEVGLIYLALPYIKSSELFCVRMPNKWNFTFDSFYFSLLILTMYVPGSPHLYTYMLGQRKKGLSKSKRE